jgi:hypothetical protein
MTEQRMESEAWEGEPKSLSLIGQVSAIVERAKEKPMSSDSIYQTGVADQMNHREDLPLPLLRYVCCHDSFPATD